MKLTIDEQKFLAAVDKEGDHEIGAGMPWSDCAFRKDVEK